MPKFYKIKLKNATRNNDKYLNLIQFVYMLSENEMKTITEDINKKGEANFGCYPYDIAHTLTKIFIDNCTQYNYSASIDLVEFKKNL